MPPRFMRHSPLSSDYFVAQENVWNLHLLLACRNYLAHVGFRDRQRRNGADLSPHSKTKTRGERYGDAEQSAARRVRIRRYNLCRWNCRGRPSWSELCRLLLPLGTLREWHRQTPCRVHYNPAHWLYLRYEPLSAGTARTIAQSFFGRAVRSSGDLNLHNLIIISRGEKILGL